MKLLSKITLLGIFLSLISPSVFAQKAIFPDLRNQKQINADESIFKNIPTRNVGPTVMSGRVVDVDVSPDDPSIFYVAYASGGLWKTKNNGTTFSPIFDNQTVMTIGDIAVDWKNNIIWVGTGENNSSRSSYAGNGIYKSSDGGKSWQHLGLPKSHHIGRIILHPKNPNIAWVAALGHLYTENQERGIYKTINGGKSWKQTLFVNPNAGAIDLIVNPKNPNELYTSTWERTRRAWDFTESGAGSGIYKSINGGDTWELLTVENSGFPTGEGVGRIGLSMFNDGNQSIIYAVLDNQFRREEISNEEIKSSIKEEELEKMSKEDFLNLSEKAIKAYLKENNFPKKYSAKKVIEMIENDEIKPIALVDYLYDANNLLFDTPVIGTQVYQSTNGGKSWTKTHDNYLDNIYYSYGYYFGQIRVSPIDKNKVFIMGVPILRSDDGGKNFKSIQQKNVHADHHALWINPNREGHLINGNDGGINISYDDGENWIKCNSPAVGQFYAINVDMAEPYNIYGGLQDNGVWVGANNYKASKSWKQYGHYPYKELLGGDGMQIEIDNRDNNTVYTGYQFGNYFRINKTTEERSYIKPKHLLGEKPLRFNWQTPIHLSVHNQDILYFGSNKLHRSFNQGEDFKAISEDLTQGGKKGDVAFGTLTTISESKFAFGLIYVGTDDGLIHITKDGGNTWTKISDDLPQDLWVSRVQASKHNKARVYISLNAYRNDNFKPYAFVSNDYGTTWKSISENLPDEPVNVIKEDPKNENIIYVGTDNGTYISLNKGENFMPLGGLPNTPVHDLVIHPKANDLIIGTHGRSIYVTNIEHLQKLNEDIINQKLYVFDINKIRFSENWGSSWSQWAEPSVPKIKIPVFVKGNSSITMTIKSENGLTLKSMSYAVDRGLNYLEYDLTIDKKIIKKYEKDLNKKGNREIILEDGDNGDFYLYKGQYEVIIETKGEKVSKELKIVKPKKRGNSTPNPESGERD